MTEYARFVAQTLQRAQLRVSTEAALQVSIETALEQAGIAYEREMRLSPRDRPDFLCDKVVIEAKVRCPKKAIFRQLERYAEHDRVKALILVSATAMGLPAEIRGKPVFMVSIGMGLIGC